MDVHCMAPSRQERVTQIEDFLHEKFHLPREQVREMVPSFLTALVSHMASLESALHAGDLQELGRAGHTIKGALLNLGLHDCVESALTIERGGKAKDGSIDYRSEVGTLRERLGGLLD